MRLFESLLWTPGEGYFLLSYHLERMEQSARELSFRFSRSPAMGALESLGAELESLSLFVGRSRKVRLFLEQGGVFSTDHEDTALREPKGVLKLAAAKERIDPDDPLVRHKVTGKTLYMDPVPAVPSVYDDVLFFNTRDEACETTRANIAIKMDGTWYTPPVSSGLLPGTFRRYLIKNGQLNERVLKKEDLLLAEETALINSVRRWMPAQVIPGGW
ncbi:MAG: aminotransferase class IV [Spirochaetales bacterium]|nr:aminotransferase class IV [Spirochaetales bacterium]